MTPDYRLPHQHAGNADALPIADTAQRRYAGRGALGFADTSLDVIFGQDEFEAFKGLVRGVCEQEPEVVGVLLTGSFVQRRSLQPVPVVDLNSKQHAYYEICMQKGRKLSVHPQSDLDVWVCLRDTTEKPDAIRKSIDGRAAAIIDWAAQRAKRTPADFVARVEGEFDNVYKQESLYSDGWKSDNPVPWMADGFKGRFTRALEQANPNIIGVTREFFDRDSLDRFVELRAYPVSTFNIKPHMTPHGNGICRDPFPYFIRDLVALERNCIVLYADEGYTDLPYPFAPDGKLLGEDIAKHIEWEDNHERYLYTKRFTVR